MAVGTAETSGFKGCLFIAPYDSTATSDLDALLGTPFTNLADYFNSLTPPNPPLNVYNDPSAVNFPTDLLDTHLANRADYKKIGCVTSLNLGYSANAQELACMGEDAKRYVAGQPEYDISFETVADVRTRQAAGITALQDPGQVCLLAAWCKGQKFKWYFLPDREEFSPFMIAGVALIDSFSWDVEADGFNNFSVDAKAFAIIKGQADANAPAP